MLGHDAKVYWDNGGTFASPTWEIIGTLVNDSISLSRADIPLPKKANDILRHAAGQLDYSFDITIQYELTDNDRAELDTSIRTNASIRLAFSDGAIATSGTEFIKADCVVLDQQVTRDTDAAVEVTWSLKVADTSDDPEWDTTS